MFAIKKKYIIVELKDSYYHNNYEVENPEQWWTKCKNKMKKSLLLLLLLFSIFSFSQNRIPATKSYNKEIATHFY
jgi:hypothetical protein